MHMRTERTQVLLTTEQRRRLELRASAEQRSMGAVIRDAIDAYVGLSERTRLDAAEDLLQTEAPVADWEEMKAEIVRGATAAR